LIFRQKVTTDNTHANNLWCTRLVQEDTQKATNPNTFHQKLYNTLLSSIDTSFRPHLSQVLDNCCTQKVGNYANTYISQAYHDWL